MNAIIETRGDAATRGRQQGERFPNVMADAIGALSDLPVLPRWLPAAARQLLIRTALHGLGRHYLRRHRTRIDDDRAGSDGVYLRALARSLNLQPAEVYGLNAIEIESANVGFKLGCTSLGIDGERTASGTPRLVYNHDFPGCFAPFLFARRSRASDAHQSLSLTYPLMVGAICGVNEHGLAASYNQAYVTDIDRLRPSTLVSLLVQRCLDRCTTVEEASNLLKRATPASGALVTLVDANGERAAIELSPTRVADRSASPGELLYSFNKYRVDEMGAVEIPVGAITTGLAAGYDIHAANICRERRLLALDQGQVLDHESMLQWMSDHDGGSGDINTICQHDDPLSETIMTAIVDPAARAIDVVFGKPCKQRPVRYELGAATRAAA